METESPIDSSYVVGPRLDVPAMTVPDVLERWASQRAAHPAVMHESDAATYGQLLERVEAMSQRLATLDLPAGARVALLLDNSVDWVVAFLACSYLGLAAVPINTRLTASEIRFILEQSEARCLLAQKSFGRSELRDLLTELEITSVDERPVSLRHVAHVIGIDADESEGAVLALQNLPSGEVPSRRDALDAVGLVQFTSGTTGFPKGACLTQRAIVWNAWLVGERLGMGAEDRMYSPMPFYHVGGAVLSLLLTLVRGATLYFPTRFDAQRMLAAIDDHACTVVAGVETMLVRLGEGIARGGFSGHSVRAGWGGGPSQYFDMFPGFVSIYGLSENSPNAAMAHYTDPLEIRRDTCGHPQPGIEIGIAPLDDDGEAWVETGEVGEIRLRGWSVMKGYLNDEEATQRTITPAGWLRTGDLGRLEDGRLIFVGRAKDTVRIGGEIVASREIESVLEQHPRVAAAFVVATPDAEYMEVPTAFVQTTDRSWGDELAGELHSFATARMARFKVPRYFLECQDPPLTESGKVQKAKLQRVFLEQDNRGHGAI